MMKKSDFKISKFPVMSKTGNEYLVDIRHEFIYGTAVLTSNVYIENKNRIKFFKFDHVYSKESNRKSNWYKCYVNNYVALTKQIIEEYEEKYINDIRECKIHNYAIEEFKKWNGSI